MKLTFGTFLELYWNTSTRTELLLSYWKCSRINKEQLLNVKIYEKKLKNNSAWCVCVHVIVCVYEHMWERKYTCHKRNVKFYFYVLYCAFYKFFFSHLYMRACLWMCFWMCACMLVVKRVGTLWKCKTTHFWICTVTACVWLMIDARSCSCLTSMMKPLVTFTFVFQNQ